MLDILQNTRFSCIIYSMNRNNKISIRISNQEKEYLNKCAKESNLSLSMYLRNIIMNGKIIHIEPELQEDIKNLNYQIRKIGVNLNQIVKLANQKGGGLSTEDWEVIADCIEKLNKISKDYQKGLEI